ncbi:AIPR family protein [Streptomyces sp. 7-21]|uniref:AIPR family protein n=1 Tax=Streptomyces sp. 7-21 TaxID=2802283 RepID=UPI001F34A752|nr:AIPR family protein [Streptomyces sp. 7-21]
MSKLHVGYVRKAIEERFDGLIDMSDQARLSQESRHQAFLSRGLAALATQIEHPCSDRVAASRVFDGQDDQGLDAIAVEVSTVRSRIRLVQAKWSDQNKGAFGEAEVHKMFHGLELMLDRNFGKFNRRFQPFVPDIERAYETGTPKITLVLALMREAPLSDGVRELIKIKQGEQNQVEQMVEVKILDLRDFHRAILGDAAAPKINAKVQLECFGQESTPYKAMYGTMTVPDLADLYEEHPRGLFARNIRDSLDESDVNLKIRRTLREEPEHFWYFSNGITMLCETITPLGRALPGKVGHFQLTGVSVVNGAQTVSAIHRAFKEDPDAAQDGRVLVRLISLEHCPPGFGDQVTTTTNTQNPIEERDFKSLDQGQLNLRDAFALKLNRIYVIKRGEAIPTSEHGCSITEAAEALAATSSNAQLAAIAKRDQNLLAELWEDHNYQEVFGAEPNVYRVWRCVELLRAVRTQLHALREGLVWRADAAAFYGDLLVTHIVYRRLSTRSIEDPGFDWSAELAKVPDLVRDTLFWVLHAIDEEYGTSSHIIAAVRNTERIERVVRATLRGLDSEKQAPPLNADYQVAQAETRGRRISAVSTLVAARRIPNGTVLEYRPYSKPERREMVAWLAEDPRRTQATWSNEGGRYPLQWHVDKEWYSPSGLARKMRHEAAGVDSAVQGTLRWFVPGEGSLDELALAVRLAEGNEPTEG